MSINRVLLFTTFLLGISTAAQATVTEPDGLVVPVDSTNTSHEVQVYTALSQAGNDPEVNWASQWKILADTKPETFSPLCTFKATLILNQTASHYGIGWYNVDMSTNTPPPVNQIYEIIPPNSGVGTTITGQSIKDSPNYKGGLIGFALEVGTSTTDHYSESRLNIQCTKCSTPGPWITSVTYQSQDPNQPNTFYLGFEDGTLGDTTWANDGDFNDYVFKFSGLTCQGGGQPCTVPGVSGICSVGVTQCSSSASTCLQVTQPESVEKCDGLDNDCNGQIDDGAVCDGGQVCDHGHCVTSCSSEFPCANGLTCDGGLCVNEDCTGVTCSGTTSCVGGVCVDPCASLVCPGNEVCRVGRCVDPCNGVTCGAMQACKNGACVLGCDCAPCTDPAQACSATTNLCVDKACANVTCDSGMVCKAGTCVDSCQGAVCPDGQTCLMGDCYDIQGPSQGTGGGDVTEGGGSVANGCSCRIGPGQDAPSVLAFGAALFVLALTLRRRPRQLA